jgi:hypothetical protein
VANFLDIPPQVMYKGKAVIVDGAMTAMEELY